MDQEKKQEHSEEDVQKSAEQEFVETVEGQLEDQDQDMQDLLNKIAILEDEAVGLKDAYLRKQADLDNYRKRMIRDKEDAIRFANKDLLQDLLPVIDDFERAIGSAEDSRDFDSFLEGVKLIEKQFVSMLEKKWGLIRMESLNQEFDPQEHEALMMIESDQHDTQTVIEDFQKGYYYQDRVLRHAKVKVAVPAKSEA